MKVTLQQNALLVVENLWRTQAAINLRWFSGR